MPCSLCGDIIPFEVARCPACGAWAGRREFRAIGVAVFVLLGFNAFLSLGTAVSLIRLGRPLAQTTIDDYDGGAADHALTPYTDALLISMALAVVTWVAFVAWLWRARRYVEGDWPQRHGRGWIIAGWFCPVANLWIPPRVVHDVWVDGAARTIAQRHQTGLIVIAWWVSLLGVVVLELAFRGAGTETLDQARTAVRLGIAGAAAHALSAGLCMMIVFYVTRSLVRRAG